mmetsp:Transcript_35477/g.92170  ORF Transcript_35477/g.92170 Transcript_35477/m.92170 type:complete len:244 (-) Transcript_35477:1069-1800(-)
MDRKDNPADRYGPLHREIPRKFAYCDPGPPFIEQEFPYTHAGIFMGTLIIMHIKVKWVVHRKTNGKCENLDAAVEQGLWTKSQASTLLHKCRKEASNFDGPACLDDCDPKLGECLLLTYSYGEHMRPLYGTLEVGAHIMELIQRVSGGAMTRFNDTAAPDDVNSVWRQSDQIIAVARYQAACFERQRSVPKPSEVVPEKPTHDGLLNHWQSWFTDSPETVAEKPAGKANKATPTHAGPSKSPT